jgi:membrane protease YdiL (CAAX protease family)
MPILVTFLPILALVVLANWLAKSQDLRLRRWFDALLLFLSGLTLIAGLLLAAVPAEPLGALAPGFDLELISFPAAGLTLVFVGVWGALASLPAARRQLARLIPIQSDSPVHALALVLAGYLIGNSLFTLTQGGLEELAAEVEAASIETVLLQQLFFVLLGLLGVGLGLRRAGGAIRQRLALIRLRPRQLIGVVGWVVLLVMLQSLFGFWWLSTSPGEAGTIEELNSLLLADIDTLGEWFLLAAAAGVGEELLFRGALQPVFGLPFTAFIFAFAHIQYGLTPVTLFVFVLGAIFGVIRHRTSTSYAILVHFGYDFALGILALLARYLEPFVTG